MVNTILSAITLNSESSFITVQGCTIKDLNDIGVFHVFGHDQKIINNFATNIQTIRYDLNHTDFIQSWGWVGSYAYNILIEGITVTNSSAQLGNTSTDGNPNLHDWTFRNNIFANIDASLFSGIPNTFFYNNIFYNVGKVQGYAVSLYHSAYYNSKGVQFINNVFISDDQDIDFHDGNSSDVTIFKNNYFAKLNFSSKNNGEAMGLNFINGGDPKFTNIKSLDFHLMADSPLIGKGSDLSSLFTTDKEGTLRTGTWSIGPYSYVIRNKTSPLKPPSNLRILN